MISLWVYTSAHRTTVPSLAGVASERKAVELAMAANAGIRRGAKLHASRSVAGEGIDALAQSIVSDSAPDSAPDGAPDGAPDSAAWNGSYISLSGTIQVPKVCAAPSIAGRVTVWLEKIPAPIAVLPFMLRVRRNARVSRRTGSKTAASGAVAAGSPRELAPPQHCIRSGFASCSRRDIKHAMVFKPALEQNLPGFDLFVDLASTRSGTRWQRRLQQEIAGRDRFFLFWSRRAQRSTWVRREWTMALGDRGLDFIAPVPLELPVPKVPPELAELHFDDPWNPGRLG